MAKQRCSVLDVKLVKRSAPKLQAHSIGETRPDEAMGREEWLRHPVIQAVNLERSAVEVDAILKACDAIPRSGQRASRRMMLLLGGPPPFEAEDAWPQDKVLKWGNDCSRWVKKAVGKDSVIESLTLHLDERSPHLHVTVIPVVHDAKGPKLSAKTVQRRRAGLPDKGREIGPQVLGMVQSRFHAAVGARYGLQRMRPGPKRPAEPIDREKGLRERLEDTQRLLAESERRGRQTAAARAADRRRLERSRAVTKGRERAEVRTKERARAPVKSEGGRRR